MYNASKIYIGMTSRYFKRLWDEHKGHFNKKPEKRTENAYTPSLYTYIWELQDKQEQYLIEWEIIDKGGTYNPVTRKCMLCIKEKYHIMYSYKSDVKLNKRNEIFSKCRHIDKKRLCNIG